MRKKFTWKKNIIAFMLMFLFCVFGHTDSMAAEKAGNIYISVEKFTIGQGYLVEPSIVPFYEGEKFSDVLLHVLEENGYEGITDNGSGYFYLSGITNADTGVYQVPACITTMGDMTSASGEGLTAPTGRETNVTYPNLEEFSYMSSSGWMYSKNGVFPEFSMGDCQLSDGDIMRVQFTLYGYGADLGSAYKDSDLALDLPDRDAITKRLALINENKAACFMDDACRTAYRNAYEAVIDLDTGKTKMNSVFDELPTEEQITAYVDNYNTSLAQSVMDRIEAIGEVTLAKEQQIREVRNIYNTLNDAQKQKVTQESLKKLEDAENTIVYLKNEKAANAVIDAINSIGNVDLSKEGQIKAARAAYNALTNEQRAFIPSATVNVLTQAENILTVLKAQKQQEKLPASDVQYTPSKTKLKSAKKQSAKSVRLTWKKVKGCTGYEVYMSKKKNSGYKKIATLKKAKKVTYTKKKLKKKKTYYFKVRTYKTVNGKKYYSTFSNVKKVKMK